MVFLIKLSNHYTTFSLIVTFSLSLILTLSHSLTLSLPLTLYSFRNKTCFSPIFLLFFLILKFHVSCLYLYSFTYSNIRKIIFVLLNVLFFCFIHLFCWLLFFLLFQQFFISLLKNCFMRKSDSLLFFLIRAATTLP